MRPLRVLVALALVALAPSCAAVSALSSASAPLDAYALTPAGGVAASGTTARILDVEIPTAGGGIDTDRILIKPDAFQAQYLPGVRWVDAAPALMQGLIVASLQDSGAFRRVGRPSNGPLPDYTLLTDLRAFQAEATTAEGPPYRVRVGLVVSIVREEDRQIVATRSFEAEATAATADPPVIVPAFDAATDEALRQTVAWVLATFGLGV
jgi:cholesterol transport system auxiliary component